VESSFIDIKNISLIKQDKHIISNFSLEILQGEKINIYGKNGSGKTSLLKIIAGITRPSSGKIVIGHNIVFSNDIFYIGHKYGLKNEISIRDNLTYIVNLNGAKKEVDVEKELNFYDIKAPIHSTVKYLSHGQKKIVSLIAPTLINNKIWILDEPFTGLDQCVVDKFITRFDSHVQKLGSIIITSHNKKEGFKNIELC